MPSKILVVGSLNADLVLEVPRFPAPGETIAAESLTLFSGGKGANQAFGAAKLGGAVSMLGQVGDDSHGGWLCSELSSAGVDVSYVRSVPETPTGTAMISVDAAGQNQIVIVAGANGSFGPSELAQQAAAFAGAKVVLLQLEIPLETVQAAVAHAKRADAVVVLDPAPVRALPDALLADVDYLTPNESELCLLTGASSGGALSMAEVEARARKLLARGARKVLVKLAERGALLISAQGARAFPPFTVSAVDSTAAGDAFNAGLGCALARGLPEARAVEVAMAAGACAVTKRGAQSSMPSLAELSSLMNNTGANTSTDSVW
jgi:ribokinase